jgi:septal ring factor EnvC (AmiA/AmiB activator)
VLATALGATLVLAAAAAAAATDVEERGDRLQQMQEEIAHLQQELRGLSGREQGLLGQLERLGTEARLREAELAQIGLRLQQVRDDLSGAAMQLQELERAQQERGRYLAFRLREIYKAGPEEPLRRLLGGQAANELWAGLRYASFLSARDGRVLDGYRRHAARVAAERDALAARQERLERLQLELAQSREALSRSRSEHARSLDRVRQDQRQREAAIGELQVAAEQLTRLVDSLPQSPRGQLDIRKFKGLLDWPGDGPVSAGFGTIVHPRFKTRVPHPGLDIAAPAGADVRSVFDGQVVFADWMRGYGLTVIVDHGNDLLSVYAHASALLVSKGEGVVRGQRLAKVGDTGSLRGPLLYFELRERTRPIDPLNWLRPR